MADFETVGRWRMVNPEGLTTVRCEGDVVVPETGTPYLRRLVLEASGHGQIRQADIEAVASGIEEAIPKIAATVAYRLAFGLKPHEPIVFDVDDGERDPLRDFELQISRQRRVRRPDSDFERIAEVYRDALDRGLGVQASVARAMHVTSSQAATLIAEARRRGLLPPTTKGKARA